MPCYGNWMAGLAHLFSATMLWSCCGLAEHLLCYLCRVLTWLLPGYCAKVKHFARLECFISPLLLHEVLTAACQHVQVRQAKPCLQPPVLTVTASAQCVVGQQPQCCIDRQVIVQGSSHGIYVCFHSTWVCAMHPFNAPLVLKQTVLPSCIVLRYSGRMAEVLEMAPGSYVVADQHCWLLGGLWEVPYCWEVLASSATQYLLLSLWQSRTAPCCALWFVAAVQTQASDSVAFLLVRGWCFLCLCLASLLPNEFLLPPSTGHVASV